MKRIVVAGCRDYYDYQEAKAYIDFCISQIRKEFTLVFVSGNCKGADSLGERYAMENGFEIERHIPQWEKYGKFAGPIRNKEMAKSADFVICFRDGKSKGTKSMIAYAKEFHKPIRVKYIHPKSDSE